MIKESFDSADTIAVQAITVINETRDITKCIVAMVGVKLMIL